MSEFDFDSESFSRREPLKSPSKLHFKLNRTEAMCENEKSDCDVGDDGDNDDDLFYLRCITCLTLDVLPTHRLRVSSPPSRRRDQRS